MRANFLAIESDAGYYYPEGPLPLDFKNNYWSVTTVEAIDNLIDDYNDIGLVVGSGVSSIIIYVPFLTIPVQNAGIH